ncbi:MAG: portal protein [Gemmatimonadales bacterium]|nr:MAG: portal protein [Gemmatimonadales bacterium]
MLSDVAIIEDLGLILLGAVAVVFIAQRFRVPSIVAYIVAGLLLGPVLGLVSVSDAVEIISELGIALLLFLVGLELSLAKIRDVGRVAVVAGIGQVIFTAAGGLALCFALGFGLMDGIFIATALTFSSTVVVVKLLDLKGELDSVYGRIAVGIFLVQDLVVVVALTFLAGLGRGDDLSAGEIATNLGIAFAGMGLLLVIAAVAAKWILPKLMGRIASSQETLLVVSLAWCFAFVLGAEKMELSLEIGAFLAGLALAQLPYNDDLRRRVHPLMNFFIAVFFVSLGIQMEFSAVGEVWFPAIILALFVLIGNPFIFMILISRMGYGERTSFLTSVTVAQISEFSFIFAAMGLSAGLIGQEILSLVAVVGLTTIAVSAFMILYNHELYARLKSPGILRFFRAPEEGDEPEDESTLRNHIIVVGMNAMGRRIAEALHGEGHTVLAVDTDPRKLEGLPVRTLLGNVEYSAVLDEARMEEASLLVSTLHIEEVNRLLAYKTEEAGVPCAINVFDPYSAADLRLLHVEHLINSQKAGVDRIVSELGARGVFEP